MFRDGWQFFVDRGGTFTDIVALAPDGTLDTHKVLSQRAASGVDPAVAGIQELLQRHGATAGRGNAWTLKIGTTVATNALLERRGEPTLLVVTRGFRDQQRIGYQNRPRLFDLNIELPLPLYAQVVEAEERLSAQGEVLQPLNEQRLRIALEAAYKAGLRSVAIAFVHAWRFPEHERRAERLAYAAGFTQVSTSHQVSPLIKFVARAQTAVADAYLSPVVRAYAEGVQGDLRAVSGESQVYFMKSSGELARSEAFTGKDAVLSGPAGGITAMVSTALRAGYHKLVGLDMGGTSADISHFSGDSLRDCEREFDTQVAGIRLRVPTLLIHTIAAGGGSVLHFDGARCRVGPDSAGAVPGPACYGKGGPLTITDCNLVLGRIQPEFFPKVFGVRGDAALDVGAAYAKFEALASSMQDATSNATSVEDVAEGFLRVAIANMANAIKVVSIQRGHDLEDYTLVSFGGAGGQHACAIADELGITRVLVHPLAGVLSALGMGMAPIGSLQRRTLELPFAESQNESLTAALQALEELGQAALEQQGVVRAAMETHRTVHLKIAGTDSTLPVACSDLATMRAEFQERYRQRYHTEVVDPVLIIDSVSVEVVDGAPLPELSYGLAPSAAAQPASWARFHQRGGATTAPVYLRHAIAVGQRLLGPAIISEASGTTVVDAGWQAVVTERLDLVIERLGEKHGGTEFGTAPNPVFLEVFNGILMSIAEQMGVVLANTARSINIKERLDFSCAIFDGHGNLVANAPHVPVHLGSMSETVKTVLARNPELHPGDAFLVNDPYNGGTHLPDITAVMPVFCAGEQRPQFFVAARGHHADVGGITPGSMPPHSRTITEEGVLIDNFKLQDRGVFRTEALVNLLRSGPYPARNVDQNLADIHAQLAACTLGQRELLALVERYGKTVVDAYLQHVQDNAEQSVRRAIAALRDGSFECPMDSGAVVRVSIVVNHVERSAVIDFTGTSAQLSSNYNAPPAVVHAAVLYVFRCLVGDEIPLNAGCFKPLTVIIPPGSMLAPRTPAATVAGNVETSQCVVDALFGALGTVAASQGTMNNLTLGNATHQYYETIAGGSGAGPTFDGAAAVQTHMTNSRMTDTEVFELRYPVLVEEHSIRAGSGGTGQYRGGDGALRRIRVREAMDAAILANRRTTLPYGLAGGNSGEPGAAWIERGDGSREALSYAQAVHLNAGDVIAVATPSGGGYGAAASSRD